MPKHAIVTGEEADVAQTRAQKGEVCHCGPGHDNPVLKGKKGLFGPPNGKTEYKTSYVKDYLAPPSKLYTGISPNIGLKERVEGVAGGTDPSKLGLGEHGKSSYQIAHVHMGDAYRDRVRPDPAAKVSTLKMDKGNPGYTTTYSVWGADNAGLPIPVQAAAIVPKNQTIISPLGYGLDGNTMYTSDYPRPQTQQGYIPNKIVTKEEIEGVPPPEIQPYGTLCKSLMQESYGAPAHDAYRKEKHGNKKIGNPIDPANLGLGEGGMTQYKLAYTQHSDDDYGRAARPRTGGFNPFKANLKMGGGKIQDGTSYTTTFLAPPKNLYTGVSPNIGLKARVEGVAGGTDPSKLGLGEHGKSSYQIAHVHMGDAYRDRVRPDPAAKVSTLKMDKGNPGYTTTYSVWGADNAGLPIPAQAAAIVPKNQTIISPLGYGLDGNTMYTSDYPRPQTQQGYIPNKIVTKEEIEGVPPPEIQLYGTLCKSLMQESYGAPAHDAYRKQKPKDGPRDPAAVGTVPPDRDYGLGQYGDTTYHRDYVNKNSHIVCAVCGLPLSAQGHKDNHKFVPSRQNSRQGSRTPSSAGSRDSKGSARLRAPGSARPSSRNPYPPAR